MKPVYKIMFFVSIGLIITAVIAIGIYGLRFGVDFRGGSAIQLTFNKLVNKTLPSMTDLANVIGEVKGTNNITASPVGNNSVIIRLNETNETTHQEILQKIRAKYGEINENSFNSIGPTVGSELRSNSVTAIIILILAISVYIAFVFRKLSRVMSSWAMSIATIVALLHDVIIPVGVFSLLGHFIGVEISAVFVAAILTILGYSVSDSVVVLDRVRENVLRFGSKESFGDTVHKSIIQTIERSLATNATTLLSLVAIFFFGGETVKYFSLALIIGIFLGAYSSIFVASPILVWWSNKFRRR